VEHLFSARPANAKLRLTSTCTVNFSSPSIQTASLHPPRMFARRFAAHAARSTAFRTPMAWQAPVRSYAQAASQAPVKPPVPLFGIDGTYASALVCYEILFHLLLCLHKAIGISYRANTSLPVHRCGQNLCPRYRWKGDGTNS
jgi:hypothetical protein